jgi:hypothetical protein
MRRKREIDIERSTHNFTQLKNRKKEKIKTRKNRIHLRVSPPGEYLFEKKEKKKKAISENPFFSLCNGSCSSRQCLYIKQDRK